MRTKRPVKKGKMRVARPGSPSLLSLFSDYRRKAYQKKVAASETSAVTELRECYLHSGLVLYLGAGTSRSLGLPSWQELVRTLTVTMMVRKVRSAIEALGKADDEQYWKMMSRIQGTEGTFLTFRTSPGTMPALCPSHATQGPSRHNRIGAPRHGAGDRTPRRVPR
jgi:hypothetical protein